MIIGFSTGCLYKTHDRLSRETIALFRKMGCNAIELMVYNIQDAPVLLELEKDDFVGFEYISIHTPSLRRLQKAEFISVLSIFETFSKKHSLDAVVVHPDEIEDWKIFDSFELPFLIENMDNRKASCKNVEDLQKVFLKKDAPMVLDVNHCYSNDSSMVLAKELVTAFGDRIKEIHLSGFESFHEPIYKTQQREILDAIPDKKLPIIIESVLEGEDEVKKEFEYVRKYLAK